MVRSETALGAGLSALFLTLLLSGGVLVFAETQSSTLADSVGFSDSVQSTLIQQATLTDSVAVGDSQVNSISQAIQTTLADTISFSDGVSLSLGRVIYVALSDVIGTLDSIGSSISSTTSSVSTTIAQGVPEFLGPPSIIAVMAFLLITIVFRRAKRKSSESDSEA